MLTGAPSLLAQSAFDPAFQDEAGRVMEYLEVFTDRTTYVVNEKIRLRADYRVQGLEAGVPWSDVLYLELVSASGQVFSKSKQSISGSVCLSDFTFPAEILTGNYYLKCYTRWMRNRGPDTFSYVPVRIINPFKTEVVEYSNGSQGNHPMKRTEYGSGLLEITGSSPTYNMGGEASFHLSIADTRELERMNCCVTIVPVGAIDTVNGQTTGDEAESGAPAFSLKTLPDMGGASISGRLVHQDGSPGAYAMVHFSLLGSDPGYSITSTDENGHFVISTFGSTGGQEFFVAAKSYEDKQVEVRIDQDFDQGELHLPEQEFAMTGQERDMATKMAIRMQLARTFEKEPARAPLISDSSRVDEIPFYGTPGFRLDMDDFVNLPNLEEVFINLVPDVEVIQKRGRHLLQIESVNQAIALYPLLIMIDHIPVFDQEAVMDLSPEKIRRIDVINEIYVKGDVSFGGVISIFSRKGDMAGIDLPQGSYFFDFQTLEPLATEEAELPGPGDRIPDTRNTILWLDDVTVDRGSPVELRCIMPDQPGDYMVFVRGVTPAGKVHSDTERFRVD